MQRRTHIALALFFASISALGLIAAVLPVIGLLSRIEQNLVFILPLFEAFSVLELSLILVAGVTVATASNYVSRRILRIKSIRELIFAP